MMPAHFNALVPGVHTDEMVFLLKSSFGVIS
jgi:hypothetical protein